MKEKSQSEAEVKPISCEVNPVQLALGVLGLKRKWLSSRLFDCMRKSTV